MGILNRYYKHKGFILYFFIALSALAVDFGSLSILVRLFGVHYLVAAGAGFCLGVVVNFTLSTKFVFKNARLNRRRDEFVATLIIALIGLGINEIGLWALVSYAGASLMIAKIAVSGVVFLWNYFIRKWLLYSKQELEN